MQWVKGFKSREYPFEALHYDKQTRFRTQSVFDDETTSSSSMTLNVTWKQQLISLLLFRGTGFL